MTELVMLAIKELPNIVAAIKERRAALNPTLPPLTDEEVIAALRSAIDSSIAKDEVWLETHPAQPR